MAEFADEERGVRFTLPDKITVRGQLRYFGALNDPELEGSYERYWEAAKALIENWKCKLVPDINIDLDKITDPEITGVILWAGRQVMAHFGELEKVSKN